MKEQLRMKYLTYIPVVLALFFAVPVSSQFSNLGLQYPLGVPKLSGTGSSLSLGGCATGISNDFFGFTKNPANLGVMNRAIFSGLLSLKFMSLNDDITNSQHTSFEPNSFLFSFPLAKYGAIGVAFNQLSATDLIFKTDTSFSIRGNQISTTRGIVSDGGTTEWQLGYGLTPLKNLRVGIAYQRTYFKNSWLRYIKNDITLSDSLVDSTNVTVSSNGFSGGVMYTIDKLTLGLSGKYYTKGSLSIKNSSWGVNRYVDTAAVPKEQIDSTKTSGEATLAPVLSLGASYKLSPAWLVAADVDITFWEQFHTDKTLQYGKPAELSNAVNVSIGTQYIPAPNLLTPKYYEIIQYRGGFRFTRLPGSEAYETALTLGTGLPLKQGGGIFDLYIEAGRRWDKRFSGLSENFFGFSIGLNGGQKWFQSTEEGY
ncbi:MAG: hypothetical protein JW915_09850 [Chitinispirillaceae bacterium]|nr:hypothetical protein [Chitinispirillaceae bacterium]